MHIINSSGTPPLLTTQVAQYLSGHWQMAPALFGAALLAFDTERVFTTAQTARAVAALSILLIVTWSYEFGAIMSHFRQAAGQFPFDQLLLCVHW